MGGGRFGRDVEVSKGGNRGEGNKCQIKKKKKIGKKEEKKKKRKKEKKKKKKKKKKEIGTKNHGIRLQVQHRVKRKLYKKK